MHYVYVIQSLLDKSFYVGRTSNLERRLEYHNSIKKNIGETRKRIPWKYYFVLEVGNPGIASKIERHIKRMKSRIYIENLVKYPEIGERLFKKYS
ncbi:MAG: GIY-YIG nuclease family protein [Flavobacteriaceae bacterium]